MITKKDNTEADPTIQNKTKSKTCHVRQLHSSPKHFKLRHQDM
jgi:hypothetical protein